MKTIKFRAYSDKFKDLQPAFFDEHGWFVMGDGEVAVEEKHIMQFTGLKDKNGKEIYEGDIVRDTSLPKWIWEIYFDTDEAKFWCKNNKTEEEVLGQWNASDDPAYPSWDCYEVIGNIWENPELLKQ